MLPLGADIQTDGTAKHCWFTRLIPYLEASTLYSQINQNLPWNHPIQDDLFRQQTVWGATIPGVEQTRSADGYGLLHYVANPNSMHRNHYVSFDDMSTGTAHNWLCGEAAGNYQPWGYPFNWRPLNLPFCNGPNSYGVWPDGGYFGLADGSVRFFTNKTDQSVLTSLKNATPIATREQATVPEYRTETTTETSRREWLPARVAENHYKGTLGTTILYDRSNKPFYADVFDESPDGAPVWDVDHKMRIDLQGVLENFPTVRLLNLNVVNDTNAAIIVQFHNLEFLQAREFDLTEKGDAILKSHPKLKTIVHR